jgi:hypothetical protein
LRFLMTFTLSLIVLGLAAIPSFHAVPRATGMHEAAQRILEQIAEATEQHLSQGAFGGAAEREQAVRFAQIEAVFAGRLRRAGFLFELWLPARNGGWLNAATARSYPERIDHERVPSHWCVFAWPERRFDLDRKLATLFVDAHGELYACAFSDVPFLGSVYVPHPSAVLRPAFDPELPAPAQLRGPAHVRWRWLAPSP